MDYPRAKFGDCRFSRFGSVMRTDRQTDRRAHRQMRMYFVHFSLVTLVGMSNYNCATSTCSCDFMSLTACVSIVYWRNEWTLTDEAVGRVQVLAAVFSCRWQRVWVLCIDAMNERWQMKQWAEYKFLQLWFHVVDSVCEYCVLTQWMNVDRWSSGPRWSYYQDSSLAPPAFRH